MTEWPEGIDFAGSRFSLDCAHRVINDRDTSLSFDVRTDRSEDQLLREEEGVLFEYNVRTELVKLHKVADLALINDYQERVEATIRAMSRGDAIIVGAALPSSEGRSGAPDLLVKAASQEDKRSCYFPADIKNHKPLEGNRKATVHIVSTLKDFAKDASTEETIGVGVPNENDSLILSHYWRLLETLEFSPKSEPFGAIVGSDKQIVWRSLVEPLKSYDEQFANRLDALLALIQQKPPHTKPIWNPAWCNECHWQDFCKEKLLNEQHVSLIKGVSYSRAVALASLTPVPITKWSELANAVASEINITRWPRPQVEIDHARARLEGGGLPFSPRETTEIVIPRADVEIDFDMESITNSQSKGRLDCVYLWGTLTTIHNAELRQILSSLREGFHGFSIFEDNKNESSVLADFWEWAQDWISQSVQHNFSLKFYCYHGSAESSAMRNVVERSVEEERLPSLEEIEEFKSSEYWVDVEKYVGNLIWPTENQSLKTIGKVAGAEWQDGANGALSTVWFDAWIRSKDSSERESLKNQLLEYNRNDVEATLIIRDWINAGLQSDPPKILNIKSLDGRIF